MSAASWKGIRAMRIVVSIPEVLKDNPRVTAMVARGFLRGVIACNRLLIRARLVPPLYESGVRYQPEPWAGRFEEFADALTCYQRGWADCDDLSAWRCAEIQEAGGMAWPKIYWRDFTKDGESFRMYHGEVRIYERRGNKWVPTDIVEDVSRFLGMSDEPRR